MPSTFAIANLSDEPLWGMVFLTIFAIGCLAFFVIRFTKHLPATTRLPIVLVASIAFFVMIVMTLHPRRARIDPAKPGTIALYNMKQIALAMHFYAAANDNRLPPAVLYGKDGRPLHSWRVLLLPYLEAEGLYRQFKLDEPWNSAHNLPLLERMPDVYRSPLREAEPFTTFCQLITGKGTAYAGKQGPPVPADFTHGRRRAILAEAAEGVRWTEPSDIVYEPDQSLPALGGAFPPERGFLGFGRSTFSGFHIGFSDGSARLVKSDIGEGVLREFITKGASYEE